MEVEEGELVEGAWTCYSSPKIPFSILIVKSSYHSTFDHACTFVHLLFFCFDSLFYDNLFFQVLKPMMLVRCWNSF